MIEESAMDLEHDAHDFEATADYLDTDVPAPRPRLTSGVTWVLLFLLTAGGGFWAGAWMKGDGGSSSSPNAAAFLAAAAGAANNGAATGAAGNATTAQGATGRRNAQSGATATTVPGANGAGGFAGQGAGATFGTVKLVDHGNVYVQTAAGDVVKIQTDPATTISVVKNGTVDDLHAGATVVVQGAAGADGTITATSITDAGARLGAGAAGANGGAATGRTRTSG
jgi:hypothetical protein